MVSWEYDKVKARVTREGVGGQIWCLPSHFYDSDDLRKSYAKTVIETKKSQNPDFTNLRVFFPINKDGNHWVLVVASLSSRTIVMYDSLLAQSKPTRAETKMFEQVEAQVRQLGVVDDAEEKWRCEICPVARQSNLIDCGVYMCIFADAVSEGRDPPSTLQATDITRARRRLLLRILQTQA